MKCSCGSESEPDGIFRRSCYSCGKDLYSSGCAKGGYSSGDDLENDKLYSAKKPGFFGRPWSLKESLAVLVAGIVIYYALGWAYIYTLDYIKGSLDQLANQAREVMTSCGYDLDGLIEMGLGLIRDGHDPEEVIKNFVATLEECRSRHSYSAASDLGKGAKKGEGYIVGLLTAHVILESTRKKGAKEIYKTLKKALKSIEKVMDDHQIDSKDLFEKVSVKFKSGTSLDKVLAGSADFADGFEAKEVLTVDVKNLKHKETSIFKADNGKADRVEDQLDQLKHEVDELDFVNEINLV